MAVQNSKITFRCETCTGRGRVEIYGNDFTSTRSFNTKRDTQPFFPLTMQLGSGEYMLMYWQNGERQKQLMFSVKTDEEKVVTVKWPIGYISNALKSRFNTSETDDSVA